MLQTKKLINKIENRILELESLLKAGRYVEATLLIPEITKFGSILTDEQRDFLNAARYAISNKARWN